MAKNKFVKWYNRDMPIITLQYWHKGEYYGLAQLTDGAVSYNPLFIYQKGKGVDVFYNVYNDDILIAYFKKHPQKFYRMTTAYLKECQKMIRFIKKASPKDFDKLFQWHVTFWPKFSTIITLGGLIDDKDKSKIAKYALNLRRKTEKIEYISGNTLLEFVEQLFPDHREYINYLTYQEIISQQLPSIRELNKRKKSYIYFDDHVYTDLTVEGLERLRNIRIDYNPIRDNLNPPHFIEGAIAAKGKVRGIAKVIMEIEELVKVKKGDILVTAMTTPDYLLAMKKAAAFVTDEGGITCHAAIVAREFNKPCVIGTKTATQFIKDGDKVEVDANLGIVRIMRR